MAGALGAVLLVALDALAQSSAALPASAASGAMARAQRAADGPIRAILEAGKGRAPDQPEVRRPGAQRARVVQDQAVRLLTPLVTSAGVASDVAGSGATAPAAAALKSRPTAAARATAPPTTQGPVRQAVQESPRTQEAPVARPVPVAATPPPLAPSAEEPRAASSQALPAPAAPAPAASTQAAPTQAAPTQAAPALPPPRAPAVERQPVTPVHRAASTPAAAPPPAAEAPRAAEPAPPAREARVQQLRMVEPEVPQRLLDQLSNPEVHLEFTIEADGSVSGITLLSPAPRLLPFLREAIEQWRYAPLPESRRHRVTLIFGR